MIVCMRHRPVSVSAERERYPATLLLLDAGVDRAVRAMQR